MVRVRAETRYKGRMIRRVLFLALLAAAAPPQDSLLDFTYRWPAAVDAAPALRARLAAERDGDRTEAMRNARADRDLARSQGRPFNGHFYHKIWSLEGRGAGLISLTARLGTFEGGAHPNSGFSALLWDRRTRRPVEAGPLLGMGALARLRPRYCAALAAERSRRGIAQPADDDIFPRCPAWRDVVLAPADRDHNGRFDTLRILIGPYVAGPYVEGSFELRVGFRSADLAAIRPAYRASFEAARRRR
jgi:hypothetical protein